LKRILDSEALTRPADPDYGKNRPDIDEISELFLEIASIEIPPELRNVSRVFYWVCNNFPIIDGPHDQTGVLQSQQVTPLVEKTVESVKKLLAATVFFPGYDLKFSPEF
jgi:hypothetical protein